MYSRSIWISESKAVLNKVEFLWILTYTVCSISYTKTCNNNTRIQSIRFLERPDDCIHELKMTARPVSNNVLQTTWMNGPIKMTMSFKECPGASSLHSRHGSLFWRLQGTLYKALKFNRVLQGSHWTPGVVSKQSQSKLRSINDFIEFTMSNMKYYRVAFEYIWRMPLYIKFTENFGQHQWAISTTYSTWMRRKDISFF